jgi:acyl-[acyl-carrier-protein] desaturase
VTTFEISDVLEEGARRLLERHLCRAKEWFPHQLIPWTRAHDFDAGKPCEPQGELPDGVASALWVGLLTEDNLPHYFHVIARAFPPDSSMGEWTRRWSAEEARHAIVIRDWISVTRSLDLVELERARMRQMTVGFDQGARGETLVDAMAYLALQELATRISHWNTGQHLDASGAAVMRRVAADENLHFLFYRDMVTMLLEADPSEGVLAIDRQVTDFAMPGAGIADFSRHATRIAAVGIYDYRVHYEDILLPVVVNHWRIAHLTGLSADAERAREHLLARIARMKRVAERIHAAVPATSAVADG